MKDYAEVNKEYNKFFKKDPPVRTCISVVGLPKNGIDLYLVKVEVEVIAEMTPKKKVKK